MPGHIGSVANHFHSPVLITADILGVAGILGYWTETIQHTAAIFSTTASGIWFTYCLIAAIRSKKQGK